MTFKELPNGRYPCRITDWALEEVEKLNNAQVVKIVLDIKYQDQSIEGRWSGFVNTKDGKPNQNTVKTLLSSGFLSDDVRTLNTAGDALDTAKEMEITIEKDDKGNPVAKWLNSAGGGSGLKKAPITSGKNLAFAGALSAALKLKKEKKIKNHAPGASNDEELPF